MADEVVKIDHTCRVMRMAQALRHQLRLEIILALGNGGPASATDHVKAGLDTLSNVGYHQGILSDLGVLARVSTQRSRGAPQHKYVLSDFGKEVLGTAVEFGKKRP